MIITRKVQVYVHEDDPAAKKDFIHTLYTWRDLVRRGANIVVAHKFAQQQVRDFVYLKDDIKEKFYIKDCLKDGPGMSEQNTTYRILSDLMKGKVPSDIFSCLNQAVAHTFKETAKDMNMGKASVRSYKNNIPMPFSKGSLSNIHWDEESKRFFFTLFGIPFGTALGRDRSDNKTIINRTIAGEYKLCSSSLQIDDNKKKMFLLFCVDIPTKENKLQKDKKMFAFLGVHNPIVCTTDVNAANDYDSGMKVYEIGTEEEFNHRRRQIQEAAKRCQINNRYATGGKGRKRKCQAIDRFRDKEDNYVETKMHTYSRLLVNLAEKYQCGQILLMKQKEREAVAKEENANGDNYILRNWSYFSLKTKITYKAKLAGITVNEE